jgi:hypothetical protein
MIFMDEERRYFDAELSVSAWQPSDHLFSQDNDLTPLGERQAGLILHDAYYTLGFRPTSNHRKELVDTSDVASSSSELLEHVVDSLDVCIYAVSSDVRSFMTILLQQIVTVTRT